jgi:signal transduction histidine kinase
MSSCPTLLLVDDSPENIQVLAKYLSDRYRLLYALSGREALAILKASIPDLILLDVMMPGMDGYAVCEALKGDPATKEIPVLFVTARNDPESEARALAAGAADFIQKPVNPDVLRGRVKLQLSLQARERELQEFNRELERRVEERTQSLRDSMILAEAARRSRSQFLANVNHELRTPMNAIMGLSQLLARQISDPKLRERVVTMAQAGKQLMGLVDNIIDIADLQAGKVTINAIDFKLSKLLDITLDAWRERAEAKGLLLVREIAPELPAYLRGDYKRVGQILDNLISNAVKFSDHGHIALRAHLNEKKENDIVVVRFEVEDQGMGIASERQEAIFNVFEQADYSSKRQHGGAGIGLAICNQLSTLMQGRIRVDSKPGEGSIFSVILPLEIGNAPLAENQPASPSEAEYRQAEQVVAELVERIAKEDEVGAYMIWIDKGGLLAATLGDSAEMLNRAMEGFDLSAALQYLQAMHPSQGPG